MPGRSEKEEMQRWEILLMKTRAYEVELAGVASLRSVLEEQYARVKATRSMRDTLQMSSRDATRRIKEALAAGKEAAAGLRRKVETGPRMG